MTRFESEEEAAAIASQHRLGNLQLTALKWFGKDYTYEELEKNLGGDVAMKLAGPLREKEWLDVHRELSKYEALGLGHLCIEKWQKQYCPEQGMGANIVVPKLLFGREDGEHGPDTGRRSVPMMINQVVIAHPNDAERIARVHIKKQPNFGPLLYSSIISTTDNDFWKHQREELIPAFLPHASLAQIFPTTAQRAKVCVDRLRKLSENGKNPVDMNDFYLFETKAQLQLALFGEDQEFMEETNEKFRRSMSGTTSPRYSRQYCRTLVDHFKRDTNTAPALLDDVKAGKCPMVHGPLSNRIASMGTDPKTEEGNAMIFAFAGHDTTGHTLSWLTYELSRHPEYQKRLIDEVDNFWKEIGDRDITYFDLEKLPFMSRCIFETLRLWPAVANGTFRQLQFDEYITGPNGEDVKVEKGTYVQIINWSRHRNPDLWGPDANEFNPDREFKYFEIWDEGKYRAYNPSSPRFSPFTFPARGCIGMNFAHQEMRAILANLLKNFTFELLDEYKKPENQDPSKLCVNYGTMGPRDLTQPPVVKTHPAWAMGKRVPGGLPIRVVPRKPSASL